MRQDLVTEAFDGRDDFLKMSASEIGDLCDKIADANWLLKEIEGGVIFQSERRKSLCRYLGIGESTLSGWLKNDRVPKMAKEAYVLLGFIRSLKDMIRGLQARVTDFETDAGDLKLLQVGDTYQICLFAPREADGAVVGRVVADNIRSFDDARLLASAIRATRLLYDAQDKIHDGTPEGESMWYRTIGCLTYVHDIETYQKDFGGLSKDQRYAWRLDLSSNEA